MVAVEIGPGADLRLAPADLLQAGAGQLDGAQRAAGQPVSLFDRAELQDGIHRRGLRHTPGPAAGERAAARCRETTRRRHPEERRVGVARVSTCSTRWEPVHYKNNAIYPAL